MTFSHVTLEEAKEQVEKYKKAFDIAKEQYKELGGVVNDEFETKLREAKEHHSKFVYDFIAMVTCVLG